jgi:hypothetical protein
MAYHTQGGYNGQSSRFKVQGSRLRLDVRIRSMIVITMLACGDDAAEPGEGDADVGSDLRSDERSDREDDAIYEVVPGIQVLMDFTRGGGFYSAPFPDESRRQDDGRIDMSDFPNEADNLFVRDILEIVDADVRGFGLTSTLYFTLTGELEGAELPGFSRSVEPTSTIQLLGVDVESADYLRRYPLRANFEADGGPHGAANMLALEPLQGVPLRPESLYAVVVGRGLVAGVSEPMAALLNGERPAGLSEPAFEAYQTALGALDEAQIDRREIAGLAVFRTDNPAAVLQRMTSHVAGLPTSHPISDFEQTELFDRFCILESMLEMPVFQGGSPPFLSSGGGWVFDEEGLPVQQGTEEARIVLSLPRTPVPEGGFPVVVFVRTGGGGDRPLIDRVRRDGEAAVAGSRPADHFAAAGYAGVSIDGPHGGIRNVQGGDEQLLIFNLTNPIAMRDNIRQSALELTMIPNILDALEVDASDCPGLEDSAVVFNSDQLAILGHSMGATISPLVLAVEPRFGAAILSGAGGSWIENVIYKRSPIPIRPLAESFLGYAAGTLDVYDPALMLLQWAGEPADPPIYGRDISANGTHVLMLQGIVDTYILPPIANATSLSLELDLAGEPLDEHPDLVDFPPLETLLGFSGAERVALPVRGAEGTTTRIVVQHAQGVADDGHEVVFQTEGPIHQYRCFLASLLAGAPSVPVAGREWDTCQ